MKVNFSEVSQRHICIALFIFCSLLQRSISPLFLLPLLLQEKRNLLGQIAEVKFNNDNNNLQFLQQHSQQLNNLERQFQKGQKTVDKLQHKIQTQDTRQNLILSKSSKQSNQICLLEDRINSIQERFKSVPSKVVPIQRRTLLAIDSANLDGAAKSLNMKVDYERLKRYVNVHFGSLEARIYVGKYDNSSRQKLWFNYLEKNGYVVKTKPVTVYGNTVKANVDVDLALDIREHGVNFKNVVLCSGDGDYLPLVEQLQGLGIKVIVLASPGHTNHFLQRQADEYISLIDIMGEVSDR